MFFWRLIKDDINNERCCRNAELSIDDLTLLCDLFYLPFEHGGQGLVLLQEFNWLKSNANLVMEQNQRTNKGSPEVINGIKKISSNSVLFPPFQIQEWFGRAAKFDESAEAVNKLLKNLTTCNNRELLYDLYPYIWDIRSVISLLNSYVRWLGEYEQASVDFPE